MSPDEVVDIIVSLKETTDETDFNRLLAQLGVLIDYSGDTGNEKALREAVGVCEHLVSHNILSEHRSLLFYFCANAWSHLRRLTDTVSGTWEKPSSVECENELLNLRRAIREESFSKLSINERCQILTNLGNVFSYVGRFVESIDYWNMALDLDAGFSMTLGNRGYGLTHYAGVLYDDGHRNLFMKSAYADLNKALTGDIHKGARQAFREYRDWIEQVLGADYVKEPIDFGEFSLGDTEEEVRYRNWCIDHRLFLNPLNDILKESVVSHDCLTTPSIVVALNEGPYYPGFYNQLKQEYVSARDRVASLGPVLGD